jgi:hypothetical protein
MRLADIWRAGLDGLPLPRSAWRQTKGEGNGIFKHGLYTKEAMKERRLLRELFDNRAGRCAPSREA